jgi:hypothetical protein
MSAAYVGHETRLAYGLLTAIAGHRPVRVLFAMVRSASKQDWNGGPVEDAFGDTPQEQMANAAGASRPDNQQLRPGRAHSGDQFAQRFAGSQFGTSPPPAALEFVGGAIERSYGRFRACSIDASHFTANRRSNATNSRRA